MNHEMSIGGFPGQMNLVPYGAWLWFEGMHVDGTRCSAYPVRKIREVIVSPMELYLFSRPHWEELYNCSKVNIDDVPFAERFHPTNGIAIIVLFVIFEVLYFPCIFAIYRHAKNSSCYKLLFFIGIADIFMIFLHGLETGIFCFTGAVFCSNGTFIYITGCFGAALFVMETSANFFLALERCAECMSPFVSEFLFSKNRPWIWTGIASIFALSYLTFCQPAVYSGVHMNWFMNPYQGYHVKINFGEYNNLVSTGYHMFLTFGFPAAYLLFIAIYIYNLKHARLLGSNAQRRQRRQIMMFIQVAIINGLNVSCFVFYTIMQHLPMSNALMVVGYYLNYFVFGFPPIIFLVFNKTIRKDCLLMIKVGPKTTTIDLKKDQTSNYPINSKYRNPANGI